MNVGERDGLAVAYWAAHVMSGAGEKSRTPDLRITNALLYQLSYAGVACRLRPRARRDFSPAGGGDRGCLQRNSKGSSFFGTATFFSVA